MPGEGRELCDSASGEKRGGGRDRHAPAGVKRLRTAREHTDSPLTILNVPLH